MPSKDELERLAKNNPKIAEALAVLNGEVGRMERQEESARLLLARLLEAPTLRPKKWSYGANAPYYKKKFALKVKLKLESFLVKLPSETDHRRFILDASELHMSRVSYHQMFLQGWIWLCENDEDKEKWAALRKKVSVSRSPTGIALQRKHDAVIKDAKEMVVEEKVTRITWKDELETFLQNGVDDQKLVCEDVILEDSDVHYIQSIVDQSDGLFIKKLSNAGFILIMNRVVKKAMQEL